MALEQNELRNLISLRMAEVCLSTLGGVERYTIVISNVITVC